MLGGVLFREVLQRFAYAFGSEIIPKSACIALGVTGVWLL